ncbi:MAG: hypothetical protein WAO21_00220 [Verrucomicrobiia bacterium]
MKTLRALVAGEDVGGGVAFRVADVQTRAARIWKHVKDVKFGRQLRRGHFSGKLMALGKRVPVRQDVARIKRAKGLLFVPKLLPFGLDQMKRILPAAARHRTGNL